MKKFGGFDFDQKLDREHFFQSIYLWFYVFSVAKIAEFSVVFLVYFPKTFIKRSCETFIKHLWNVFWWNNYILQFFKRWGIVR